MSWPKKLVLVRHAESEGNVRTIEERVVFDAPTWEYPLTKKGREQAEITGKYLHEQFEKFDIYYVSYYVRSKETMDIMFPQAHVYEDARLAEGQRGIWHSMKHADIEKQFPHEIIRKKREGLYHFRPLGGENWPDIEIRIHSFLGTLARDYGGKTVLIVVHGHWLLLFQKLIHHFSIEEALVRYEQGVFENASVTIYEGTTISGNPRLSLVHQNIVPWKDKI